MPADIVPPVGCEGNAKHLSGSLRQLVCFINDQSTNIRQDGAVTAATMNGVCQ